MLVYFSDVEQLEDGFTLLMATVQSLRVHDVLCNVTHAHTAYIQRR